MKDIEHIDTETQNTVGLYRRCCPDAPGEYTFYRYPPGAEPGEDGTITQQPIPQQIIFRDRPVKLPDGVREKFPLLKNLFTQHFCLEYHHYSQENWTLQL